MPQDVIALYQSAYRQTIASGTGHVPLHIMAVPCTRAIAIASCREWYMVELTRIELVITQCHCVVIPLHYSPKICEANFDPDPAFGGGRTFIP